METFTFWTAIIVVILTVIALVKRIETRLVLLTAGFFLCCISLDPMAGLNQFAKSMTNSGLIQSICSSMGFAFLVAYTKVDLHLVQLLTRPMKALGIFLIPACTLVTGRHQCGHSVCGRMCRSSRDDTASGHDPSRHQSRWCRRRHPRRDVWLKL